MNSNVGDLIAQYRDKGILIDTSLFLVLLVGNIDRLLLVPHPAWMAAGGRKDFLGTHGNRRWEICRR